MHGSISFFDMSLVFLNVVDLISMMSHGYCSSDYTFCDMASFLGCFAALEKYVLVR